MSATNFPWADEEWLELPQDPSYLISTYGRLYDLRRRTLVQFSQRTSGGRAASWSIRSSGVSTNRYVRAAETVLLTFVGPGKFVMFADGNDRNVRLDNLRWKSAPVRLAKAG